VEQKDSVAVRHSLRFRRVANKYPHIVSMAYGGDLEQAARDSDEEVAARVADWERSAGGPVRDWQAIGSSEGKDEDRGLEDLLGY
jgi:hypothetical protein